MSIALSNVRDVIRKYILDDADQIEAAHTDDELDTWIKYALTDVVYFKRHLLIDDDGNPKSRSDILKGDTIDIPEKYESALVHGALMRAFSEDQQRSSFERGQFLQALGMGGK